jgi:hypothetical protein
METNYALNRKIRKAFIAKFNGNFDITEVKEDSILYYTKEGDKYIYWGVKYTYVKNKLVIDWESVWHPRSPYTSFNPPEGKVIISMDIR